MAFSTREAVTEAANSAGAAQRVTIQELNSGRITEDRIQPVVEELIGIWIAAGARADFNEPTLRPVLILESVRLAEAINLLEPMTGPDPSFLPHLTQDILVAGTMKIDQRGVSNIQEAGRLLTSLAADCTGPLGAVYGVQQNAPEGTAAATGPSPSQPFL